MKDKEKKFNNITAARLYELMREKKMTQKKFAENVLFVSETWLSQVMKGTKRLSIECAELAANYCHVLPGWILGYTDFKTEKEIDNLLDDQEAEDRKNAMHLIGVLAPWFKNIGYTIKVDPETFYPVTLTSKDGSIKVIDPEKLGIMLEAISDTARHLVKLYDII